MDSSRRTYVHAPHYGVKYLTRVHPIKTLTLDCPARTFTKRHSERVYQHLHPYKDLRFLNTANRTVGYWPLAFVNWGQDNILPFDPGDVNYDKTFDQLEDELP